MKIVLFLFSIGFAASALVAPALAVPTIDGVISPGEWNGFSGEIIADDRQDNNGVGGAGPGGHRGDHPDWTATWYVDWDDTTLYYGIVSRDGEVTEESAEGPQEIGATWEDDSFEFFINTGIGQGDQTNGPCECRHESSYQILLSADEVLNDTQGNGASAGQQWDFGWDGEIEWKVNVPAGTTVNDPDDLDEGWSGELSIPFEDMGLQAPLDGQTFGWNVVGQNLDTDGGRNRRVISWSNPAGIAPEGKEIDITSLHQNDRWGSISFVRGAFYTQDGVVAVPGDFNSSGARDIEDIDLLTIGVMAGDASFDLDGDGDADADDRIYWVETLSNTYFGDSNLDGEFNSGDFVQVFQQGEYEDATAGNSGWADGDWNGDKDFNSGDFVLAFQAGGYEAGPRAATSAVPEPSSMVLLLGGFLGLAARRRR